MARDDHKPVNFDKASARRIAKVVRAKEAEGLRTRSIQQRPSKSIPSDELPASDADYKVVQWDNTNRYFIVDWVRFHA